MILLYVETGKISYSANRDLLEIFDHIRGQNRLVTMCSGVNKCFYLQERSKALASVPPLSSLTSSSQVSLSRLIATREDQSFIEPVRPGTTSTPIYKVRLYTTKHPICMAEYGRLSGWLVANLSLFSLDTDGQRTRQRRTAGGN